MCLRQVKGRITAQGTVVSSRMPEEIRIWGRRVAAAARTECGLPCRGAGAGAVSA